MAGTVPDPDDPLVRAHATANPYRTGASLILRRLAWDLRPAAWASRRRLRAWRNRHAGERAVILCNGPSLLEVDFDALSGVFTFGLNKINLLFDKTAFRPSCVVAVNPLVIEQNREFFNATDLPLFIDAGGLRQVRARPNVAFLHSAPLPFARDVSISLPQGNTVTFVAIQLAFHMGFAEVALVGCDHSFAASGPANKTVTAEGPDRSHFDPNYFAAGTQWQLPDLFESEVAYMRARRVYEAHGRRLVNATAGGRLEILERQGLAAFLGGGAAR